MIMKIREPLRNINTKGPIRSNTERKSIFRNSFYIILQAVKHVFLTIFSVMVLVTIVAMMEKMKVRSSVVMGNKI